MLEFASIRSVFIPFEIHKNAKNEYDEPKQSKSCMRHSKLNLHSDIDKSFKKKTFE